MSRGKRWLFTLNNYTDDEYTSLCAKLTDVASYWIIGKEIGEGGTPHLQGYCELRERHRFLSLKNTIFTRAHLELARGTGGDNRRYCAKEANFREEGTISNYRQGDRRAGSRPTRDVLAQEFVEAVEQTQLPAFALAQPGTWYFSGFTMLRNYGLLKEPQPRPAINVNWFWGPPGTGKSRRAHETLPMAYCKDSRTKWWNGYLFQSTVIMDDFGPNAIDITRLLVWFDRYRCNVETKGGMLPLCADTFIVTSNYHPRQCFTDNMGIEHVQYPALERRIVITEFNE